MGEGRGTCEEEVERRLIGADRLSYPVSAAAAWEACCWDTFSKRLKKADGLGVC